jgi:hypothetical protein
MLSEWKSARDVAPTNSIGRPGPRLLTNVLEALHVTVELDLKECVIKVKITLMAAPELQPEDARARAPPNS